MEIGVFSKFDMAGGSEMRCAYMANGIAQTPGNRAHLFCEKKLPSEIKNKLDSRVIIHTETFHGDWPCYEELYKLDHLLTVNTDSKSFTTLDYWEGRSDRHSFNCDVSKIPSMSFLFNFIVSPARHLHTIQTKCKDVRILVANQRFFDELSWKDKHDKVRHLPRMVIESPIDLNCVSQDKVPIYPVRIGKHSHALGSKFNAQHAELIEKVNAKYKKLVHWDFMGVPGDRKAELEKFDNVTLRNCFSMPVIEYLKGIHIFLFFISWDRQEPWARAVAEALASGCPVLAPNTDGGTKSQVIQGNTGFLCKTVEDFEKAISTLLENPPILEAMRKNSITKSKFFSLPEVIRKFLMFIQG